MDKKLLEDMKKMAWFAIKCSKTAIIFSRQNGFTSPKIWYLMVGNLHMLYGNPKKWTCEDGMYKLNIDIYGLSIAIEIWQSGNFNKIRIEIKYDGVKEFDYIIMPIKESVSYHITNAFENHFFGSALIGNHKMAYGLNNHRLLEEIHLLETEASAAECRFDYKN